jgi:hypothetical protein
MGHPAGMLVTGLVYYFKALAKAYYKAADKVNQIADGIESGDTSALENSNDDYFKSLGKNLMSALTAGLIRGYVESVVSTGLSQGAQHLGGVQPGSTTGSILDGVTGGGVRLRAARYGGTSRRVGRSDHRDRHARGHRRNRGRARSLSQAPAPPGSRTRRRSWGGMTRHVGMAVDALETDRCGTSACRAAAFVGSWSNRVYHHPE